MRHIFIIFAFAFMLTSCQKKQSYKCMTVTVYREDSTTSNWTEHTFTEKEKASFEKSNTIDKDGMDFNLTAGEVSTKCVLK